MGEELGKTFTVCLLVRIPNGSTTAVGRDLTSFSGSDL